MYDIKELLPLFSAAAVWLKKRVQPSCFSIRNLALVGVLVCSGCANAPFYNEARDKQGQALKKATTEVKLVAVVEALEARYAALSELELSTHKTRLATSRDFEISLIAVTRSDIHKSTSLQTRYVEAVINKRLKALLGKVPEISKMQSVLQNIVTEDVTDELAASRIRSFNAVSGLNVHDCAGARRLATFADTVNFEIDHHILTTIPARKRLESKAVLASLFEKFCKNTSITTQIEKLADAGIVDTLKGERVKDKTLVDRYKVSLKSQQNLLATQQKQYAKEVKALTPVADDAGYRAKLAKSATGLEAAVTQLKNATQKDDAFALAHAEALVRLESLEAVLGALASGVSDPAKLSDEQRDALLTVRLIPTLADEADKLLKEAQRPHLGPFLLAKEHQRLVVEGFQSHVALLEQRSAMLDRQMGAAVAEALALFKARLALGASTDSKGAVNLGKSMAEVADGTSKEEKYSLFRSLAYSFDEAKAYRLDQESLGLKINTMSYDMEIQKSKTAALMWESLLTNLAAIVSDFHAAGIKSSELAEFLKGIGLVTIGTRVVK